MLFRSRWLRAPHSSGRMPRSVPATCRGHVRPWRRGGRRQCGDRDRCYRRSPPHRAEATLHVRSWVAYPRSAWSLSPQSSMRGPRGACAPDRATIFMRVSEPGLRLAAHPLEDDREQYEEEEDKADQATRVHRGLPCLMSTDTAVTSSAGISAERMRQMAKGIELSRLSYIRWMVRVDRPCFYSSIGSLNP